MRLGSLSRRAIASGATASGGETIAPSRKPTDQGTDKTNYVERIVQKQIR